MTTTRRHHRHRALAELDRLIARTKEARARCLAGAVAEAAVMAAGGIAAGRVARVACVFRHATMRPRDRGAG